VSALSYNQIFTFFIFLLSFSLILPFRSLISALFHPFSFSHDQTIVKFSVSIYPVSFSNHTLCHLFTGDNVLPSHSRHVSQHSTTATFQDVFNFPVKVHVSAPYSITDLTQLSLTLPLILSYERICYLKQNQADYSK